MVNNQMFVIDSNIFAKLLIEESDSHLTMDFFTHCVEQEIPLLAPSLFTYEILQITTYYDLPIRQALTTIEDYKAFNLNLVELTGEQWELACTMIKSGHPKSGFPSIYDCCYHALAIKNDCTFITADKRHADKTSSFGHLQLLKDWKSE